jgi:hypothetical protein
MSENISPDGLTINDEWKCFFSKLAFRISGGCRKEDDYPGTIVYYFEVARMSSFNAQRYRQTLLTFLKNTIEEILS